MLIDIGTHTGLSDAECATGVVMLSALLSVLGFFAILVILGFVVDQTRSMLERWQMTFYRQLENDHIIVLGWSDKTLFLLNELTLMLESTNNATAVIVLSPEPVDGCIKQMRAAFGQRSDKFNVFASSKMKLHGCKVAFFQGSTTEPDTLYRVSIKSARIVLAMGDSSMRASKSDQMVLRTILAAQAQATEEAVHGRLIAEVRIKANISVYRTLGHGENSVSVEPCETRLSVNVMLVLYAVAPVLACTFSQLMSYDEGNEMYIIAASDEMAGMSLDELAKQLPHAVVLGLEKEDWALQGIASPSPGMPPRKTKTWLINPPTSVTLQPGDRILGVAWDKSHMGMGSEKSEHCDTASRLTRMPSSRAEVLNEDGAQPKFSCNESLRGVKCIVIIGWPWDMCDVLVYLDLILSHVNHMDEDHAHEVHILAEASMRDRQHAFFAQNLPWTDEEGSGRGHAGRRASLPMCRPAGVADHKLKHLKISHYYGAPDSQHALQQIRSETWINCDSVLILSNVSESESLHSDSSGLTSLLLIRNLLHKLRRHQKNHKLAHPHIVCEILDIDTKRIIQNNRHLHEQHNTHFFHSNQLETGLFATYVNSPDESQLIHSMLQNYVHPQSHGGKMTVCVIELGAFIAAKEIERPEGWSYWRLSSLVRQWGGVLIGFSRPRGELKFDDYVVLNPKDKAVKLRWLPSDSLLVVS